MTDEPHYYVAGYTVADDPYCQANGVLVNHFNLTTIQSLEEIEAELSALAIVRILQTSAPSTFSVEDLCAIHQAIFGEIYPWAGQFRRVDIAKGDTVFETYAAIPEKLAALFADCAAKNYFADLSPEAFSAEAGIFLVELNRIHPFREGNGRTQRVLLLQIALNAGYSIRWGGVSPEAMRRTCIAGLQGDCVPMQKLLRIYLEPVGAN